jgi:citronellol/citronellal dehydrogenase
MIVRRRKLGKLQDKIAIVTGSSRGLGKAIALNFAREGAHIVVASLGTDEDNPRLPGTIKETVEAVQALGRRAIPVACNVANEESVIKMVEAALKEFGTIDILMNNAGVAVFRPTVEMTAKHFDLVINVNVRGTFLCSKYALPTMIKNKKGNIINMSSPSASNRKDKLNQAYGMAKAAIERFTYGLAAEVAEHNIAVNCTMPRGAIGTEGVRLWNDVRHTQPNWDTTEMIEKATLFLAQQDAAHGVSGTVATDEQLCAWHAL